MLDTQMSVIWSAEDLPPRIRADTRGLRPVPRGSAELPPKYFSSELRRTSAERPPDSGGLRRTPRGSARIRQASAANWRSCSLEKCPPEKIFLISLPLAEELPPRTSFRRGHFRRGHLRRGHFRRGHLRRHLYP